MFRSTSLNVLFIVGIAVLMLGVLPLWGVVADAGRVVSDTEALIAELQNLQQRKDALVKTYNSVSDENIKKLEAVIPASSRPETISFLYLFLENLARENGLRVDAISVVAQEPSKSGAGSSSSGQAQSVPSFSVSGTTGGGSAVSSSGAPTSGIVQTATVSIRATGSYESFKAFLQALESNLRIMDVSGFSVAPGDKGLQTAVTIKTYFQ